MTSMELLAILALLTSGWVQYFGICKLLKRMENTRKNTQEYPIPSVEPQSHRTEKVKKFSIRVRP